MLFSRRDLVAIVFPLMVEQFLSVLIGMADSMMVASVGEAAVSGVSLVDSLNLLMVYVFSALATGGAVVCSQFLGKRDFDAAQNAAKQLVYTTTFVSLLIMAIAIVFRTPLLSLVFGSIEADVMANAKIYFLYTAISYPFLAIYSCGAAIFRAMGNSKISMRASILMNLINVAGNAILIYIFHLGAAGAAIATLFSRIIGAILMMWLVKNKNNPIYIEHFFKFKPNFAIIKRILGVGIPSGVENGIFQLGKLLTQSLISTFGTAAIAANAAASALTALQYIPATAIGLAMITIIGRCVGAGEKKQAKHYTLVLCMIGYAVIIPVSLIMTIFANPLIGLYNLSASSSAIAYKLMVYHAICVSIIYPFSFPLGHTFRAANDVKYPLVVSISCMWIFRVGLSYVLGGFFDMGIMGVWIAMTCDWLARSVLNIVHFVRGKWLDKYKAMEKTA